MAKNGNKQAAWPPGRFAQDCLRLWTSLPSVVGISPRRNPFMEQVRDRRKRITRQGFFRINTHDDYPGADVGRRQH